MIGIGIGINRLRGGAFSPAVLFAAGEPGAWFDYGDAANLDWRRNLLTYTEDFSNAAWAKSGGTTVTPGQADPFGGTSAALVSFGGIFNYFAQLITYTGGLAHNNSMWVRADTPGTITFSDASGGAWSEKMDVTTEWQRFDTSFTSAAGTRATGILTGSGDLLDVYIYGAQLEAGSTATDYQKITDVVTETRALFPKATLYQDAAGTTPVTTPGQTVALALDKSQGLVLGPELAPQDTTTTTGWNIFETAPATVTGTASGLRLQSPTGDFCAIGITVPAGASWYLITYTVELISGSVQFRGTPQELFNAPGTYTRTVRVQSEGLGAGIRWARAGTVDAYIRNVSVRELPGNHAIQGTALQRPTYGVHPVTGIRNLLTYTEDFSNAAWSKANSTVTANAAVAPDGTTTADKLLDNASSVVHSAFQQITVAPSTIYTLSFYAKASGRTWVTLDPVYPTVANNITYFDLGNGAVGTSDPDNSNVTITAVGDGWYRCSLRHTTAAGQTQMNFQIAAANANNGIIYIGNGTDGVLIWGAQLETGSTATAYQRVTSQYDVYEEGVAQIGYLQTDGVDDGMVTPTITPGTDKAQVFAGVRKLSDTTSAVLELSASAISNAGAFHFVSGTDIASSTYSSISRGSASANANQTAYTVLGAAPDSAVISIAHDISGDLSRIRRNGVAGTDGTGDKGTGNFLAYPLYIGRRGGTSLPFNGRIYQLIVRFGANLTDAQIAATEAYVAGKTGVEL